MKLNRLRLKNVCQFTDKVMEFQPGLVGIYGPNGSGKSNSMNVCCYAAITGDYSRHEQNKGGIICQQAPEGATSFIELFFSQDGSEFRIYRGLQKPAKMELDIPGCPTPLKKSGDIQRHIEEVLGIKRRLIDDHIFIPQSELFAFLSQSAADRAKSFAHLCNTVWAEKIWDALGKQITADLPLAGEVVDTTDEILEEIGGYRGRIQKAKDERAEHEKKQCTDGGRKVLEEILRRHARGEEAKKTLSRKKTTLLANIRAVEQEKGRLDTADAAVAKTEGLRTKWKTALAQATTALKEIEGEADAAKASLATLEEKRQRYADSVEAQEATDEAQADLVKANDAEPAVPEGMVSEGQLKRMQTEREELLPDIAKYTELIAAFESGEETHCPTCGTPIEDIEVHLVEAREKLPQLELIRDNLEKAIEKQTKVRDTHRRAMEKWKTSVRLAENTVKHTTRELEKFEDVEPVEDDGAEFQAVVDEEKDIRGRRDSAQTYVTSAQAQHDKAVEVQSAAKDEHTKAVEQRAATTRAIEEAKQVIKDNTVGPATLAKAEKTLAADKVASEGIAGCDARIEELDGFIDNKNAELERVKLRLKRSEKARHWVRLLTQVRDEVMHRDKLPFVVHKNYLLNMVDEVNKVLSDFRAPFHVTVSEDVGFTAHFINGTVMPAPGLSGGQKVVLALAFRLTVNSLFAPQLGTMVLDEPTDGLDAENRQMAAEFFVELGNMARDRNLQVVVITHDEDLEKIFDQKIVMEAAV
jgi:DNA repair exonuclease SbcCD ATPase subunit